MTAWFSHRFSPTAMNFLCLPQAGGDTGLFARWAGLLEPGCRIVRAFLPGRGRRFDEAVPETLEGLADRLFEALHEVDLGPYAIVGSSMGACLGYELCRRIEAGGLLRPRALAALVANPPQHGSSVPILDGLSLDEAAAALTAFNPALEPVVVDRELLEHVLPTILADFRMCRRYRPVRVERIGTPIVAFAGRDDPIAAPASVREWHRCTSAGFGFACLPGDHLLIDDPPRALLRCLNDIARGDWPALDAGAGAPSARGG